MYNYQYPMMDGYNGGWGIFMMMLWGLALVAVVVVVMRLLRHGDVSATHKADPLDIVKERYAKGEIDRDGFEKLKKDLE